MLAPSAANLLRYGALNLPPKICSKSLFSSMTMTMWSYTGSVAGQEGVSAAAATTVGAHIHRATAHRCESFGISCLPAGIQARFVARGTPRDVEDCLAQS